MLWLEIPALNLKNVIYSLREVRSDSSYVLCRKVEEPLDGAVKLKCKPCEKPMATEDTSLQEQASTSKTENLLSVFCLCCEDIRPGTFCYGFDSTKSNLISFHIIPKYVYDVPSKISERTHSYSLYFG